VPSLKAFSNSAHRDKCYCSIVSPSLCSSITLMHPAKAVGRHEMPFSRDTRVVPSNIVLDRAPVPPQEGEIWGSEPPVKNLHCKLWPDCYRWRNGYCRQPIGNQQCPIQWYHRQPFPSLQITCLQRCRCYAIDVYVVIVCVCGSLLY